MEKTEYSYGDVHLTCVNTNYKFKADYLSVNFRVPLTNMAYKYSIIPSLLNSGSQNFRTQTDICKRLEDLYGADIIVRNLKRGSEQIIGFAIDILSNRYTAGEDNLFGCLSLLYDILFEPLICDDSFNSEYTDREIKLQKEKIRAAINDKASLAKQKCIELMCADEPYGKSLIGNEEEVGSLGGKDIYFAYLHMLSECKTEIYYVGDGSETTVCEFAKKVSESIAGYKNKAIKTAWYKEDKNDKKLTDASKATFAVRRYSEKWDMVQGKLTLGYRLSDGKCRDRVAMTVFMQLLAYSPVSKLFMNVRERLSLCYYIRASADIKAGVLIISSGLANRNFDTAIDAIKRQIDDIAHGKVTKEEFSAAKKSAIGEMKSIYDSTVAIESYELASTLSGSAYSPSETAKLIEKITPEDIAACARGLMLDTVFTAEGNEDGTDGIGENTETGDNYDE